MNRGLLLFLLLGCGVLLWVLRDETEVNNVVNDTADVELLKPDLAGRSVQFHQLHEDGSLHYRMWADTINQFDDENLTRMKVPKLHLRSATQPPWDINAQEGFIRKATGPKQQVEDIVFLRDQVHMTQESNANGTITLRSESFYLYPDRQFAESHQNVIIDTEVGRTEAAGLSADLETGVIRLNSNDKQRVHTIVLPEQFKKS